LVDVLYERNHLSLERGQFRVRGDVVELCPASAEDALRIEFFGDEIERITRFDILTGETYESLETATIFPARHFVTPADKMRAAIQSIQIELDERIREFESQGKLLEAQRLKMRTTYDIDMMQEMGFCPGIENYSRHLSGRPPGSRPFTLIDFFPKDFLLIVDESHATIPQIGGMYAGDRSRKMVLVEHGFRLPSALDNRPLNFAEFESLVNQALYVSATPGEYELEKAGGPSAELIIRPTGLVDPPITLRPLKGQIDATMNLARERIARGERVLVTTLTKRTAEDLSDYLREAGFKVQYIHAEVDAIERVEILRSLRAGEVDILVGINLLREGLDLPEVSLVCILDADKEGYLRSETSLIQTAGRAARHVNGEVVLFADTITGSIRRLMEVTEYRRAKQIAYNRAHNITPRSVVRGVQESLHTIVKNKPAASAAAATPHDPVALLAELEKEMKEASARLEYERAALLRDQIFELKASLGVPTTPRPTSAPSTKTLYRRGSPRRNSKKGLTS
jgi:excinuclease ABC subunit B